MKILVTGHQGFIGSRLVEVLMQQGHEIHGIDIKSKQNVLNADFPTGMDLVIHLAGIGGVRESLADPKKYWDVNVEGTKRVLEHYKDVRVLVAGSSSQYEPHLNPYAASKHCIETIPHSNVAFMRFHTVYNESARSGMFFDKLMQGKLEYVTNHYRDFIHLEDLCKAICTVIENTDIKGAFDIGTGTAVSVKDIRTDLPVKEHTVGERQKTQADTTFLKGYGFVAQRTVEDFLREHGLKK